MARPREIQKIRYVERRYDRVPPKNNYLKHWRVVQYWVKRNYEITSADLDMLLFLYDEGLFQYEDFDKFQSIFNWDKKRFHRLMNDGWIRIWRKKNKRKGLANLYEISGKGRRLCSDVYKKLNGEVDFSEVPRKNVVFKRKKYTDKVYSIRMAEINKTNRVERLRRLHESQLSSSPQSTCHTPDADHNK